MLTLSLSYCKIPHNLDLALFYWIFIINIGELKLIKIEIFCLFKLLKLGTHPFIHVVMPSLLTLDSADTLQI